MDKSNLIVNYLPSSFSEEDLRQAFQKFGPIQSIKIVRDKGTGISMGFGFVNFENNDAAVSAMNAMNGTQLPQGKLMKVSVARPAWKANIHSNLYVSGIPTVFTDADVRQLFQEYGDSVENVRRLKDSHGMFRGIAVVRFDKEEAACDAMRKYNGVVLAEGNPPIQIKPWRPEFRNDRVDASARIGATSQSSSSSPRLSPCPPGAGEGGIYTPSPGSLSEHRPMGMHSPARLSPGMGARQRGALLPTQPLAGPPGANWGDYMSNWQDLWNEYVDSSIKARAAAVASGQRLPQQPPPQVMPVVDPAAMMAAAYTMQGINALASSHGIGSMRQPPPSIAVQQPTNPLLNAAAVMAAAAAAAAQTSSANGQQQQLQQQRMLQQQQPPPPRRASQEGEPSASLFVFHLPTEATESTLRVLFEPYGALESVRVVAGKGYGFVNFENSDHAATAVEYLNGFKLGTKHLKVEFKKSTTTGTSAAQGFGIPATAAVGGRFPQQQHSSAVMGRDDYGAGNGNGHSIGDSGAADAGASSGTSD